MPPRLTVRGAREHNLKSVDLEVPHESIVAFTGVSGSGKTSLAIDTIYREAERRVLESFSASTRRLLARLGRPDLDSIEGLRPAMALAQRRRKPGPRSTVGTLSDAWSALRTLYGKGGTMHCHACGSALHEVESAELAERIVVRHGGDRAVPVRVLAPAVHDHLGANENALRRLVASGCEELYVDGQVVGAVPLPTLDPAVRHTVAGVVPRRGGGGGGDHGGDHDLGEAVERALRIADGVVWIWGADGDEPARYSSRSVCVSCDAPTQKLGRRLFSFNSPFGACKTCRGLGVQDRVDPKLLVADPERTLREGALVPTTPTGYIVYSQVTVDVLDTVCHAHGFDVDTPWRALTEEQRKVVLYGSDRIEVPFGKHPLESRLKWKGITARPRETGHYGGIVPTIEGILARSRNENALRFARTVPCRDCAGTRLRAEARAVQLGGRSIADCAALEVGELRVFLRSLQLSEGLEVVVQTLDDRLRLLEDLGLGYLTLARAGDSLSGGEQQRVSLASQIAAQLSGMLYVLDEPSAGLHGEDRARLYDLLTDLRDEAGGSVLVVEHDPASALRADWIVDVGPGAGSGPSGGGRVVFSGPPAELAKLAKKGGEQAPVSLLNLDESRGDTATPPPPGIATRETPRRTLRIEAASHHNLQSVDVDFELGLLHAVTGVSGAGKSSLVHGVLLPALRAHLDPSARRDVVEAKAVLGVEHIDKLIEVSADPIGRTPRSNPATYTGVFDTIRALFAAEPAARERGLGKGHFSFNGKAGRCEVCEGAGHEVIPMHGLAPHLIPCSACHGRRFREEVLEVTWEGLSILQVLNLSIADAREVFAGQAKITRVLDAMLSVGVGYLTLGQPAPTLSGGEAQRVKLAKELARPAKGHTLYVLDEPSTGLAPRDVDVLARALRGLVKNGSTVLVIDHSARLIEAADRVLELGPGAGRNGGKVLCQMTPGELAAALETPTGRVLAASARGWEGAMRVAEAPRAESQPPLETELRGVRTHNLRGVDVVIPAGKLTVVTGVSGSGKSSLAMDTLYAEGHRRYAESLPAHVRRRMPGPSLGDVDSVRGLTMSLAVDQRVRRYGSRSTVGTVTEILEDLRLLFSRAGDDPELSTASAFSFHDPAGACPECAGRGQDRRCDPDTVVVDPDATVHGGALAGVRATRFYTEPMGQHLAILDAAAVATGVDVSGRWSELSEAARALVLHGAGDQVFDVVWSFERKGRTGEQELSAKWLGVCGYVEDEYRRKAPDGRGADLEPLMHDVDCDACRGSRLAPAPRTAKFAGRTMPEWCGLSITELVEALSAVGGVSAGGSLLDKTGLGERIVRRATRLLDLGLGYLSLDRRAGTLSGGEAQRVRLAAQLIGGLDGMTYVLDEPTLGLHAADVPRLIEAIRGLVRSGNRVVVVEHDLGVVAAADHVIEVGPGAGRLGGAVVYQGAVDGLRASSTQTAVALAAPRVWAEAEVRAGGGDAIRVSGAHANNLQGVDVAIPIGTLTAVTGVSGSGKSSLVFDVLAASAEAGRAVGCQAVEGLHQIERVVTLSQDGGLAASPSITPATYLGFLAPLQKVFAKSDAAAAHGLPAAAFSLAKKASANKVDAGSAPGRCEACQGEGRTREDLDYLGSVWIPCDECGGQRFGPAVRACAVGGLDLASVLSSDVSVVAEWSREHAPKLTAGLEILIDLGLGYLHLGQTADAMSGGEAQRLRLARELAAGTKQSSGAPSTLYLLDEPSTGLHAADVTLLIRALRRLTAAGSTVVLVEHDLDLIAASDLALELGPQPGSAGGHLIAACPPRALPADSATGRALG